MKDKRCNVCKVSASSVPCDRCPVSMYERRHIDATAGTGRPSAIHLDGKIRLLDEIGRGGMGTVFSAIDQALERVVAVKFLLPELQQEPDLVARFRSEAKASASISHNNVVRVFSTGRHGSSDYFVSEYIDGPPVSELIASMVRVGRPFPINCGMSILAQAAGGLAAVHAAGVAHHDVKPGNLMVEAESGRVVIMDFGIGRRIKHSGPTSEDGSITAVQGGSPAYMAPEMVLGTVDDHGPELVDIYSFGVTAYELLTGRLPFDGKTWVKMLEQHVSAPPPPPSRARPDIPQRIDDFVLRCLDKDPRDRFESAAEVEAELKEFLSMSTDANGVSAEPGLAALVEGAHQTIGHSDEPLIVVAARDARVAAAFYDGARLANPLARVEATRSPKTALGLARAHPPAVLVGAVHDPEISGLELSTLVTADPLLQDTKLLLTAVAISPREREVFRRLGVSQVLLAPPSTDAVQKVLRQALN